MFTTEHYTAIADVIRDTDSVDIVIVRKFANMLAKDNPRFKRDLFVTACGFTEQ